MAGSSSLYYKKDKRSYYYGGKNKRMRSNSYRSTPSRSLAYRSSVGNQIHRHQFTTTTGSTSGAANGAIPVYQGTTGAYGLNGSGTWNLQATFSLALTRVYINGVLYSSIPGPYTDYTGIYDNYRIDWVEMEVLYSANMNPGGSNSAALLIGYMVKDTNDYNATNAGQIMNYADCKHFQLGAAYDGGKRNILRFRPKVNFEVFDSSNANTYNPAIVPQGQQWISSSYPQVNHIGAKVAFDGVQTALTSPTLTGYITLIFKYHISCKNQR